VKGKYGLLNATDRVLLSVTPWCRTAHELWLHCQLLVLIWNPQVGRVCNRPPLVMPH